MEGLIVGFKVFVVGILVGDNVGFKYLLIDGFAVGVIVRREVGVLVLNAVGEAVNFEGPVVIVDFGGAVILVGVLVGIPLGVTAIVGNRDVSNVGNLATVGETEGMRVDPSKSLIFIITSLKSGKFTDPRPVVGSQPSVALKPCRQHGILRPVPQLF